jgi:hypothetical protein
MVINGLFIPVMSNWNWYMGGFFEILCMVVNSLFIPMMSNWNGIWGIFLEFFVWLSMDHSKDNFRNNYLLHFQV